MSSHTDERFPKKHVIGFLASIILTLVAAYTALGSGLPTTWIIIIIMVLAVIQAAIQLFMFMHMTETDSGGLQTGNILFGFFTAAVIVAGSVWVMSFGYHHDHGGGPDEGGSDSEEHEEHEDMDH
ncbi:cytochrome aa3 quinol oxidase subunit IV [Alteribacillus sp. HJP-4]|uniref:cytochrome aa3 quinol oxidase subunit IV n=1 Tax=Alteribacillus sp. HJP-4 TaxID=2775394 RepID=UPI0035CCE8E2